MAEREERDEAKAASEQYQGDLASWFVCVEAECGAERTRKTKRPWLPLPPGNSADKACWTQGASNGCAADAEWLG